MYSPRRSSGPFRGGGAAVPQTFDRGHPSLSSAGDGHSSSSQPPPRFSRRVESTVIEPQRVTVAAAPALTQPIAVVPAAVVPPPPPPPAAQVVLPEQTNAPPTRYHLQIKLPFLINQKLLH